MSLAYKQIKELHNRFVPPLIAFVVARLVISWAARSAGFKPMIAATWIRWDSAHYLSIATGGYEFFSCARLPGFNPAEFCGNTAWFPGFPLTVRVLSALGPSPEQSGVLIAAMFCLACLTLLWNMFLGPQWNARGFFVLVFAAFFPGNVYYHAVFPISMCAFFLLCAIWLYISKRFLLAGLAGAIAAFSYSSGFFLAGVFAIHQLVWRRREPISDQVRVLVETAGLTFVGFLAVLVLQRAEVGVWNALKLVQAKYKYEFTLPWIPVTAQLQSAFRSDADLAHQAAFVALLIALLVYAATRTPRQPLDGLLVLFALAYWLTPLMLGPGYVAVVRSEAMLLPIVPLAKKLPLPVLSLILIIAFILTFRIGSLFFRSVIV
jgi:hypothetical protein